MTAVIVSEISIFSRCNYQSCSDGLARFLGCALALDTYLLLEFHVGAAYFLDGRLVLECCHVSDRLSYDDGVDYSAHYLGASRLGKLGDDEDLFQSGDWSDALADPLLTLPSQFGSGSLACS